MATQPQPPVGSTSIEALAQTIHLVRGHKVMLDADLAALYGVETKRLNEQVRRNAERFPADFMIQLTSGESDALRSQTATSKPGRGGRRYAPYAFTEHGALMAATVLSSPRAIETDDSPKLTAFAAPEGRSAGLGAARRRLGVFVVRAFVQLRELLGSTRELAFKLDELERKLATHDQAIAGLIDAIRALTATPARTSRPIGFTADLARR